MERPGELNSAVEYMWSYFFDTLTFALRYLPATVADTNGVVTVSCPAKWTDLVKSKY